MKVRWTQGSIRFRITPAEMRSLEQSQQIGVNLNVPGGAWEVVIAPSVQAATDISLSGNVLTMRVSADDLRRLSDPQTEGIYFATETGQNLRYFIEKDFPCLHTRPPGAAEPPSETFKAPTGFAERHIRVC